jgi:hypothetical protein
VYWVVCVGLSVGRSVGLCVANKCRHELVNHLGCKALRFGMNGTNQKGFPVK